MDTPDIKRFISQEEINSLYHSYAQNLHQDSPENVLENRTNIQESETSLSVPTHFWNLKGETSDCIGLNIRSNYSSVVYLSKSSEVAQQSLLNAGYDKLDSLFEELKAFIKTHRLQKVPVVISISGPACHYFIAKTPAMSPGMLHKAFSIQMKQFTGEEKILLYFRQLGETRSKNTPSEYLVCAIQESFAQSLLSYCRQLRLRILAWDIDLLCYARAQSAHLQRSAVEEETRFNLIVERKNTSLLILGRQGAIRLVTLPIGIQTFLDHIPATLGEPNVSAAWLEEKELHLSASDGLEVKQKKIIVNQAISALLTSLIQQVKTHLFIACQQNELPLPTQFNLLGPGSRIFGLKQLLSQELAMEDSGMEEWMNSAFVGALGASFWNQHPLHFNLLPKSKWDSLRTVVDWVQSQKEKLANKKSAQPKLNLQAGPKKMALFAAGFVVLLAAYPVWDRIQTSSQLSKVEKELKDLTPLQSKLKSLLERKKNYERLYQAIHEFKKNHYVSKATPLKELLSLLTTDIQIASLTFNSEGAVLKGVATEQSILEQYIERASLVESVNQARLLSLKLGESGTQFEVEFKYPHLKKKH